MGELVITKNTKTVVVIGNGMVGHRFVEKLVERDETKSYRIVTFCEESRAAYDRVGLTSFFAHRDAERLMIARQDWYREHHIDLHVGDRACRIDRAHGVIESQLGAEISYDYAVLATGSYPFVPPIEGIQRRGVFVYRTIEDLEKIIAYGQQARRCAVIGGGLLGLEAAKAAYDLGLETHVIEFASRLMPRQIDDAGSQILKQKIEQLGVQVHLNTSTRQVSGDGRVEEMEFTDGCMLDVDMIIVSCGIRPRDELARECGLEVGERGGVVVNDCLQTSDPHIYAIGEVALHGGMIYGLVAPGYEMADTAAAHLCGEGQRFTGTDLSTKLKLMGVDVASFGDYEVASDQVRPLVFEDPFRGVYKKLIFDADGTRLLGGMLVGDASDYATLATICRGDQPLPCLPGELIVGKSDGGAGIGGAGGMADDGQVCSCNNVTKAAICEAIRADKLTTVGEVKARTKAGTGCGGCLPLVTDLLELELKSTGKMPSKQLCQHFPHSRQELFDIVRIKEIKTFPELIAEYGQGSGCEICKPAVASILASLWNENIMADQHHTLQDTNDRFLANMQRGGLYSVVPRVPGGEITPDKLITLGRVAKKYGLYSKITGGQRVDLFGAQLHQLPDIWEELIDAGFESGHAYGKALRTVKSCVGTTWCRYGVQDSVGLAIRLEHRYRGIRAPHKVKMAVSGCVRECAEAQCKDIGLVATEQGYNLYVCGNGGAKPRHADLLATDLDEPTVVRYIDRFMMYYIYTADKLTRTATWLEKLDGGIEYLKEVVLHDKLGIADELESRMQYLVESYRCEWKEAIRDPQKRRWFRQFVNTDETESCIEFVDERGQRRPADWPKDGETLHQLQLAANGNGRSSAATHRPVNGQAKSPVVPQHTWVKVGTVSDFPSEGGAAVKYGRVQIAVYNFTSRGQWYACQNMCPHKNAFVLSRGILGNADDEPKVACPLHKKLFSLRTGQCVSGEDYTVKVFPVRTQGEDVYVQLPPQEQLDAVLATDLHCISASCSAEPMGATC